MLLLLVPCFFSLRAIYGGEEKKSRTFANFVQTMHATCMQEERNKRTARQVDRVEKQDHIGIYIESTHFYRGICTSTQNFYERTDFLTFFHNSLHSFYIAFLFCFGKRPPITHPLYFQTFYDEHNPVSFDLHG